MVEMKIKNCKCCGKEINVRMADHKRGWGNFCNKSCKAKSGRKSNHKKRRHDGLSPMKYKTCCICGEPAVNGTICNDQVEWYCMSHLHIGQEHPFSAESLGQD